VCGRLGVYLIPGLVAQMFRAGFAPDPRVDIDPTWNLAPSQQTMVVLREPESGDRRLELLQWGFLPRWAKDPMHTRRPINARAETVAGSGMFRDAFSHRRCLVPADVFYEWKEIPGSKQKQPYAIGHSDGSPLALAGIWDAYEESGRSPLRTFALITTMANQEMTDVHHRMPVIVAEADWPAWLGEAVADPRTLLRPAPNSSLRVWPISRRVNRPQNNGPELLELDLGAAG
jgi:putative SOS response-associated peptidase YedK